MIRKPTGLAAFLGKVSGVELLKKQIHKFQDRKRIQRYQEDRGHIKTTQDQERKAQKRRHEMQALDLQRKQRALEKIEKREMKSLEESLRREIRIQGRGGRDQMPSLALDLKSAKARQREKAHEAAQDGREEFNAAASGNPRSKPIDLRKEFDRAAGNERKEEEDRGSSEGPKPASKSRVRRYRRKRKRDKDLDRGR